MDRPADNARAETASRPEGFRRTVDQLGNALRDEGCWGLYDLRIRHEAIRATESHAALRLCPLGTRVAGLPFADIRRVLDDAEHTELRARMEASVPDITEQLREEDEEYEEPSRNEALRLALAAVISDGPDLDAAAALLGIERRRLKAIAAAADNVDTPTGRRLAHLLDSPHNTLIEECRCAYGARRFRHREGEYE